MEAKDIKGIVAIQRTFTYKISEVHHLKNWERLLELTDSNYTLPRDAVNVIYNDIYLEDNTAYGVKY